MKEKDFYGEIGNWDFSMINYTVEKITDWDMYKEISSYTDENSLCLDLGTGGGEKAIKYYPKVGMLVATDFSEEMIKTAKSNLKGKKRIKFAQMDNLKINFPDEIFNLVSARHTVINAKEIYRVLEHDGVVVIEGIDKGDCIELKDVFKRGQEYYDEKAISQIDYEDLVNAGFKIIKMVEIFENEYYKTKEDLMALLLKTPIINDFSDTHYKNEIEEDLLDKYVKENTTDKGILLKRKLYGIVAQKG